MTSQEKQAKIKNRVALLQNCLEQARLYLEKNPQTDTGATFPNYIVNRDLDSVRDLDSIQEELRVLTFIQPYL